MACRCDPAEEVLFQYFPFIAEGGIYTLADFLSISHHLNRDYRILVVNLNYESMPGS